MSHKIADNCVACVLNPCVLNPVRTEPDPKNTPSVSIRSGTDRIDTLGVFFGSGSVRTGSMTLLDPRELFAGLYWRMLKWTSPGALFEALLEQPFYRALLSKQLEHACFAPGAAVLELGCGPGALGALIEPGSLRLTGCDRSSTMLERAGDQVAAPYELLVQSEAHDLPFPDNTFDGAFCASLLHLVDDPGQVLEQVGYALRPGAHLLIAGPEPSFGFARAEQLVEELELSHLERGALRLWASTPKRLGSDEMRTLVQASSFANVEIKGHLGNTMFSLRATKS